MDDAMMRGYQFKRILETVIEEANEEGWYLTTDDYTGALKLVGPWDSRFQRHVEIELWSDEG